jgi:hypothetical protein
VAEPARPDRGFPRIQKSLALNPLRRLWREEVGPVAFDNRNLQQRGRFGRN